MFLLDNCLYDNPENNPDGTAFEFPEGSKAISVDDEEYLKSLSMEDILSGNIREEWKEIVQASHKDAIKEYEEIKLNNQKNKDMSLDLAGKTGVTESITTVAALGDIVPTLFNAQELSTSSHYRIRVDTTAGNLDISPIAAPNTFSFIQDGDELEFLKVSNDANSILANDTLVAVPGPPAMAASPNFSHSTLTAYSFVDRRGENITIKADLGTNKWVVAAN
jgi:hypothetical protein